MGHRLAQPPGGIYCFTNITTGDRYVGMAKRLGSRLKEHLLQLHRQTHHCRRFQESYNEHGVTAFQFIVLETCLSCELPAREKFWIAKLNPELNTHEAPCYSKPKRIAPPKEMPEFVPAPPGCPACECGRKKKKGNRYCIHCERRKRTEMHRSGYLAHRISVAREENKRQVMIAVPDRPV